MDKATVVIGASTDPEKYSNKAIRSLQDHRITVYGLGIKEGEVNGLHIETKRPQIQNVHTVTLYVGPKNQADWIPYIYSLHPKRIIFNPGTENKEFFEEARSKGIECSEACTLVLLSIGNY